MDFRLKCSAHKAFAVLPGGGWLLYLMQRYVTSSVPVSDAAFRSYQERAERHLAARSPNSILDIGSGWDLCMPILMGVASGAEVVASDVIKGMRSALVADTLMRLGLDSLDDAHVTYRAPVDYQAMPFASGSFDLITSTSVLEHVPTEQLPGMLTECRRVLSPGGVCSMYVDMSDHYRRGDSAIGELNFLRYSEYEWRGLNPPTHFQNRLRFPDYVRLFEEAGFRVESEIATRWEGSLVMDPGLRYSEEDARITRAWFRLSVDQRDGSREQPSTIASSRRS